MVWNVKIYLTFGGKTILFFLLKAILLTGGGKSSCIIYCLGEDRKDFVRWIPSIEELAVELDEFLFNIYLVGAQSINTQYFSMD